MRRQNSDTITVQVVTYSDRRDLVLRYRDPVTRSLVTRTSGTDSRREATKLAAQWEADLNAGRWKPGQRIKWEDFRERYEDQHLSGLAVRTIKKDRSILTRFADLMRPTTLDSINAAMLSEYAAKLRRIKVKRRGSLVDRSETTIKGELAFLAGALRWAQGQGWIRDVPKIPRIQRARKSNGRLMKGRAPTEAEFEAMVKAVPSIEVVGLGSMTPHRVSQIQRFLRVLRLSGLRLEEALDFWWDRPDRLHIVIGRDGRPYLSIHASQQKSNEQELLPITREFGEFLLAVPAEKRINRVAPLTTQDRRDKGTGNANPSVASRIVTACGKAAGVLVEPLSGKYASAHDIRRLFVTDLLRRFAPAIVQKLARHSDIATTMTYYEDLRPADIADQVWGSEPSKPKRKR